MFTKIIPTQKLRSYIKYLAVSESDEAMRYHVLPSTGLVLGFQYSGQLSVMEHDKAIKLATAGITGISGSYKIFSNTAHTGSILVYFRETALGSFTSLPAHELFNESVSLHHLFEKDKIARVEEKLSSAVNREERIEAVEQFLLSRLRDRTEDKLVSEAVRLLQQSAGQLRIKELAETLHTSASPLEKRFRKIVGATPKKFAALLRFNTVMGQLEAGKSFSDICYANAFFDQAHFNKDFKRYTGSAPEDFKRLL